MPKHIYGLFLLASLTGVLGVGLLLVNNNTSLENRTSAKEVLCGNGICDVNEICELDRESYDYKFCLETNKKPSGLSLNINKCNLCKEIIPNNQ